MSENFAGQQQERDVEGKFLPGVSGNPNGRPKGSTDKRTQIREELLGPILPKAVEKLEAAVDQGERWAIELVIGFSIPKPRPVDSDEMQEIAERIADLEQLAARNG
jgi:hypothetical protein